MLLTVVLMRGMAASLLFFDRKHPRQMVPAGALAGLVACGLLRRPSPSCSRGASTSSPICRKPLRLDAARLLRRGRPRRDRRAPVRVRLPSGSWAPSRATSCSISPISSSRSCRRWRAKRRDLGARARDGEPRRGGRERDRRRRAAHARGRLLPRPRQDGSAQVLRREPAARRESRRTRSSSPTSRADAIMAHVVSGTKILREGGIPEPVVEFAYTHHGTQMVEYLLAQVPEAAETPRASPKSTSATRG